MIFSMIDISADEARMLRENGRGADVHMSGSTHKSRLKSYFLTTSPKSMKLLNEYRKKQLVETHDGR